MTQLHLLETLPLDAQPCACCGKDLNGKHQERHPADAKLILCYPCKRRLQTQPRLF